jgi:hypothetical protein
VYPGLVYGNYCGKGAKDPTFQTAGIDCVDNACREHDICYTQKGLEFWYPTMLYPSKLRCDRQLCKETKNCPISCQNLGIKLGIHGFFGCALITPFGL